MLCNPLAAAHFGLRWGSGLLPLVPEPRVARAGFSSPRVSLRGPHGYVLGRLDTGKRTRGLQVPFECVAPGRPTDGPTWRQPHLGLTHWSSTPGEGSWWMVLLLLNLLLLNSEQGCHGPEMQLIPQLRASRHPPSGEGVCQGAATIPRQCPHPTCPRSPSEASVPAQGTLMPGPPSSPRPGSLPLEEEKASFFCCIITNKIKLTLSILMIPDGFIKCK